MAASRTAMTARSSTTSPTPVQLSPPWKTRACSRPPMPPRNAEPNKRRWPPARASMAMVACWKSRLARFPDPATPSTSPGPRVARQRVGQRQSQRPRRDALSRVARHARCRDRRSRDSAQTGHWHICPQRGALLDSLADKISVRSVVDRPLLVRPLLPPFHRFDEVHVEILYPALVHLREVAAQVSDVALGQATFVH